MMYYRLLNGSRFLGKAFTFEARHLFVSQIDFREQRQILWEPISTHEQQPSPEEIVEIEDVQLEFGLIKPAFH